MNFSDYTKLILEGKQEDAFVVYSGKFQPFHINHYKTYQYLVERFGKERVYIATAGIPKKPKKGVHILDFDEKKKIITSMFPDISADKVVREQNVYDPKVIKSKFSDDTPYIAIVGQKDVERLSSGNYFSFLKDQDNNLEGWSSKGYVELAPQQNIQYMGEVVTGTLIRNILSGTDEISKTELLSLLYTKLDDYTVDFIKQKFKGDNIDVEEQMGMKQSPEEVDKNTSKHPEAQTINVLTKKGTVEQRSAVPEDKLK
jgi:hypothetical protein